nr:hypothetical protein [Tanacetum cinerariifolium]
KESKDDGVLDKPSLELRFRMDTTYPFHGYGVFMSQCSQFLHVALEILAAHNAWIKGSKEIAGLILMTMELEIQQNLEPLHAHEMLKELKNLFAQQAEQELLQTTRDFHSCRQEEGHMWKTINELHAMLKLHEQTLPKSNTPALNVIRASKVQKGDWKRNCPRYLAKLIKKKKNTASGAGGSGIFVIELNNVLNRSWIYDTGCGTHICNTTQGLRASRKLKLGALSLYDGFVNRFVDNTIQVSRNNVVYFSAIPRDGIFKIDLSNSLTNESSIYSVINKRAKLDLDFALLWHCRLGNISKKRIEKLQHDGLLNSSDLMAFEKYVSCMSGKMARKPYTHQVERAKDLLGLIHTDVCGPFKIMSRQGASYFVTFTDDFSCYGYVYLLKHIHEVFETFKMFQKEVENQLGKTIKSLRSDHEGEYMSQEFLDHLKDHEIIAYHTPLYTPQHNGVSEMRNITLLDISMMSQTTLPKSFWDYALETAARILNTVPTKKVEKTPYNVWHGKAPKLSYLKVWGCEALVKRDTLTKPDKLEPRSIKCIFVGYPKETIGYSFYYPPENKVLVARNAKFLENSLIDQEASGSLEDLEIIQEEDTHPSLDISLNHEEDDLEIDEPQSDIVPIRRSTRTQHALDRMCLYIDAEKHELGDLGEPANYKAALLDPNIPMLQSVKTYLGKCFAMKDLCEAAYILGIKIYRDRSKQLIGLCQSAYIEKILKRYCMENSKRGSIPMQENLKLNKSQGASTPAEMKRMQNVPYASAVGSIMFAVRCTRPDVAFAQNTRYVFVLNGGVVDWNSAKQNIFATSSAEAEYIATFDASKEAVWVRKFISGLGVVPTIEEPISMYCDNTKAIAIVNESGITKGARHFRTKVHYLPEVIEFNDIKLEKVHTDDNLADPFTKALAFPKHFEHTRNIGMLPASSLM